MTVKQLRERLERVEKLNPDMAVFVWNHIDEIYEEMIYSGVEELYTLDCGERIYNEET
jgi:uncharacterized protein (UPF0335 family)